ncbi:MAG TPA: helix-turn-helix domain-containing protein [Polyangiaceae bacterium]|jgi:AraC-like DNA-binding protein|nr:helix-turn-helix domain-containing protein [Polyangiaceae bacterium]
MPDQVAPPRALAAVVDAFWQHDGDEQRLRILPDGCMDFIFDLESGTARLIGAMTEASVVHVPRGTRSLGVRFLPGAAAAYLSEPSSAFTDDGAPLDELSLTRRFRLAERVAAAADHAERRRLIAEFLLLGAARLRAPDPRVRRAAKLLRTQRGPGAVRSVSRELGLGERQLERLFSAHVGILPKAFARVARFERALALMNGPLRGQATLAAAAGYSDESHLIREFRALARATPAELARERHVGFVQAE